MYLLPLWVWFVVVARRLFFATALPIQHFFNRIAQ
jgi:hypothetical protein